MSATGAMYGSMGLSAASSLATGYSQSQAIKATGRYQSTIAQTNAKMAEMAGEQALEAGDIQAGRKNLETSQKVGAVKAAQGGSGVDVASGSAAMVRSGMNLVGSIDELTIRNNAQRAAFGYKVQGIQDTYQGKMAELTADAQSKQTLISSGLSAISGPLQIYANYKMWQKRLGMGGGSEIPTSYMANAGTGV